MEGSLKSNLLAKSTWIRGLFMVLFYIFGAIARFVFVFVVIFQFILMLVTGRVNQKLLQFGNSLSMYFYQIMLFLTYNTEEKPYPFTDWPVSKDVTSITVNKP